VKSVPYKDGKPAVAERADNQPASREDEGERAMLPRPRTIASRKRIAARKAARRAGNRPALGIPPKGKGWVGKTRKAP
jgi:hypothetical protein